MTRRRRPCPPILDVARVVVDDLPLVVGHLVLEAAREPLARAVDPDDQVARVACGRARGAADAAMPPPGAAPPLAPPLLAPPGAPAVPPMPAPERRPQRSFPLNLPKARHPSGDRPRPTLRGAAAPPRVPSGSCDHRSTSDSGRARAPGRRSARSAFAGRGAARARTPRRSRGRAAALTRRALVESLGDPPLEQARTNVLPTIQRTSRRFMIGVLSVSRAVRAYGNSRPVRIRSSPQAPVGLAVPSR